MNLPPALKRRLVFGDREQADAVRDLEKDQEYKEAYARVPNCDQCLGDGYRCGACGATCDVCDGTGKDLAELKKFRDEFPGCRFCL